MLPTLNSFPEKINKEPHTYMAYIIPRITETCEWIQRVQYKKLQKEQALKKCPKQNCSPFYFASLLMFGTIWLHTFAVICWNKKGGKRDTESAFPYKVFSWLTESRTGLKERTFSCIIWPENRNNPSTICEMQVQPEQLKAQGNFQSNLFIVISSWIQLF